MWSSWKGVLDLGLIQVSCLLLLSKKVLAARKFNCLNMFSVDSPLWFLWGFPGVR